MPLNKSQIIEASAGAYLAAYLTFSAIKAIKKRKQKKANQAQAQDARNYLAALLAVCEDIKAGKYDDRTPDDALTDLEFKYMTADF